MHSLKYIPILFVLAPFFASAQVIPVFPMAFWGTVTINGTVAPTNTVIRTYYGSTLAGTVGTKEPGVYGYTEATKQKLLVREGAGPITFTVQSSAFNSGIETGGITAVTYTNFATGLTIEKNLAFASIAPAPDAVPLQSSGGGGGGGGVGVINSQISSVKKGDSNGDNKIDLLDFNALLIQWGKSGLNLSADFDKNGVVDIFDFNVLLINWGK